MFCPNCGANNPDHTMHCTNCGVQLNAAQQQAQPVSAPVQAPDSDFKDYLTKNIVLAIVSFLCCGGWIGVIFGVLGIVFSSQAKSAYASGNMAEAQAKAKTAKLMSNLALGMVIFGAIVTTISLIIMIATYGIGIFAVLAEDLMMLAL